MNTLSLKAIAGVAAMVAVSSSQAATIAQTNVNPPAGTDWNQASVWGDNPVVPANDYATTAGPSVLGTAFVAGGTTWTIKGTLRDSTTTSTFGGGNLIINPDTRLLMKAIAASPGATSTANITLNGGFINAAPNSGGVVTLAGTLNSVAPLSAIGTNPFPNSTLVLNINSTITGSGIIQLVNSAADTATNRASHINLNGDISAFTGTFYLTQADTPSSVGSDFSIASGSAPLATLELATASTNLSFSFNLNSNVTFGSVVIDGMILDPGTYGFTELDALSPGSFADNGGTITVVPEPSTVALFTAGLTAFFWNRRRARSLVRR